ncbi:MAG: YggS family pyridoxal phosphate-dependent enzyme [Elusimicrobia bacterium CG11_big_fil_rev_8_21_14_0_20_64_6]|nr:MAG: YggS family pyridoxal phosphate-dependent enzyme [Elusimicrobia bacterium CG11_big_fil_rev_8_21_14_0_20_64_6]
MFIDNLEKIRYRMHAAAARTNRDGGAISLVVVTKYASLEAVQEALSSGLVLEAGENRVLDAEKKKLELGKLASKVRWRLIGHLQTNKAKKAVATFGTVDSIDSAKVARALDAALTDSDRKLPVMIQVKLSERETQSGVNPNELPALIEEVRQCARLELQGLMGIAPNLEPLEAVRPSFRLLRELRDKHLPNGKLSMGMSRDFEIAIEEGSDMVRIGTQIFAP